MLYTNVTLNISGQRLRSGTILAATLDRMSDLRNRGIFLPTPKGLVGKLPMGFHENYIIGSTGKGYPRIDTVRKEKDLYLILSSRLTVSKDGKGTIRIPHKQRTAIIDRCEAVNRDNPDHSWKELIVQAQPGQAFWTKWVDLDGEVYDQVYFVDDRLRVHSSSSNELASYCHAHCIKLDTFVFTVKIDPHSADSQLIRHQWCKL